MYFLSLEDGKLNHSQPYKTIRERGQIHISALLCLFKDQNKLWLKKTLPCREWPDDSKCDFFFSTFWPQGVNPRSQEELIAGVIFPSRAVAKLTGLPGAMAVGEIKNERALNAREEHKPQLQSRLLSSCKEITCMLCSIRYAAAPA